MQPPPSQILPPLNLVTNHVILPTKTAEKPGYILWIPNARLLRSITEAIDAIQNGQVGSVKAAAATFGIPRSTLRGRLNGATDRSTAKQTIQRPTAEQERRLIDWIKELEAQGNPPSHTVIREMVSKIETTSNPTPIRSFTSSNATRKHGAEGLSERNIRSSWKAAGLVPWNPHKVLESSQVMGSRPISTTV